MIMSSCAEFFFDERTSIQVNRSAAQRSGVPGKWKSAAVYTVIIKRPWRAGFTSPALDFGEPGYLKFCDRVRLEHNFQPHATPVSVTDQRVPDFVTITCLHLSTRHSIYLSLPPGETLPTLAERPCSHSIMYVHLHIKFSVLSHFSLFVLHMRACPHC